MTRSPDAWTAEDYLINLNQVARVVRWLGQAMRDEMVIFGQALRSEDAIEGILTRAAGDYDRSVGNKPA